MNGPQGSSLASQRRRPILRIVVATLVAILVGGTSYWAFACPCDQTPGLFLRGTVPSAPVTDWSFANRVPLCQVQVDAGILPHALNLNCMATSTGGLYLSCGDCEGKRWSNAALANDQARVRIDSTVYPVTLTRVLDQAELDRAWGARVEKYDAAGNPSRPDAWWSFRVEFR